MKNNNKITEIINTDLIIRQKNKFIIIGNVGFKLKNFWYYFYKGGKL